MDSTRNFGKNLGSEDEWRCFYGVFTEVSPGLDAVPTRTPPRGTEPNPNDTVHGREKERMPMLETTPASEPMEVAVTHRRGNYSMQRIGVPSVSGVVVLRERAKPFAFSVCTGTNVRYADRFRDLNAPFLFIFSHLSQPGVGVYSPVRLIAKRRG